MHDFQPLTIAEVKRETPDAISVSFAIPGNLRKTYSFKPGQHLTLRTTLDGEEQRRTYSICSGPGEINLQVAIKRVAGNPRTLKLFCFGGSRAEYLTPAGSIVGHPAVTENVAV